MTEQNSEALAAVFGRPEGVHGSFADDSQERADRPQPQIAPPDPVLAEAFGRPDDGAESLQRDPYASPDTRPEPEPEDPWRSPDSVANLSDPARAVDRPVPPSEPGEKLGISDLLFGRRVHWWALATLAMVAVLVGLAGGLIGRWTAEVIAPLRSDSVSLSVDDSDDSTAHSAVSKVAKAMERSVVMIEVRTDTGGGTGSGFVIDKRGYILTNNHVISQAATNDSATLEVVFYDRTRLPARIVGRDTKTDLAVIKVDDIDNLTVAKIGDSDKLQIGDEVIAFGAPLGLDRTVTSGIVSARDRAIALRPDAETDTDAVINAIQTDASINPGNSGGPLVDDEARVIGINTAGNMGGGAGSIGLGFAIPISEAVPIAESLIRDGKVSHPQIGASAASVMNKRVSGAQLRDVAAGGPTAAAGLKVGDVITAFGGKQIASADELTVAVRNSKIGGETKFTYWRDGRTFNAAITPTSD